MRPLWGGTGPRIGRGCSYVTPTAMSPVPKDVMAVTLDCPAESPNVDDSNVRRSEPAADAASVGCGSGLALGAVVGGVSGVPVGSAMVADACDCSDPHAVINKTTTAAVTRELLSMAASWDAVLRQNCGVGRRERSRRADAAGRRADWLIAGGRAFGRSAGASLPVNGTLTVSER